MEDVEMIYIATKEGRELHRIRNSVTFRVGITMMSVLKNPLKFLISPYHLYKIFKMRNQTIAYHFEPKTDCLVIGVDKTGEFYSTQALNIANRLQQGSANEVTLISNSQHGPKENSLIQWFRLPAARENNYSRKEWNITVERILSTAISLSKPRKIIFFGDYLYRGVINSLEILDEKVEQYWFFSDYPNSKHLDTMKYPRISKICIPSEMPLAFRTKPMKNVINSEKALTFIIDLSSHSNLVMNVLKKYAEAEFIGIQRTQRLHPDITSTMSVSDVCTLSHHQDVYFIIDETSRLVPELSVIEIPGVLLLNHKIESPILGQMVSDLELYGELIVARRVTSLDLEQTTDYMINRVTNTNLRHKEDDYVVKWMNAQGRG